MMFKRLGGPLVTSTGVVMPLSTAVEVNGIVYLAGTLPMRGGKVVSEDIEIQTHAVFDNVEEVLAKEGLSLKDVFKVMTWLVRKEDFARYNAVYAQRLAEPFPTRTTVISGVALPGALLEVEFTACRSTGAS